MNKMLVFYLQTLYNLYLYPQKIRGISGILNAQGYGLQYTIQYNRE